MINTTLNSLDFSTHILGGQESSLRSHKSQTRNLRNVGSIIRLREEAVGDLMELRDLLGPS